MKKYSSGLAVLDKYDQEKRFKSLEAGGRERRQCGKTSMEASGLSEG